MPEFNARRAATQVELAAFNSKMATFFMGEVVITACAVGMHHQSLAVGLIAFVGLIALAFQKEKRWLLAGIFSIGWAILVGACVWHMDSALSGIIAGVIAGVVSLGVHAAAIQHVDDLG